MRATCADPNDLAWARELQRDGFEIAMHGATYVSSARPEAIRGLEAFRDMFGGYPSIHVNHAANRDSLYWGPSRLSGGARWLYRRLTRDATLGRDGGSTPDA